jgi:hypothetical protein
VRGSRIKRRLASSCLPQLFSPGFTGKENFATIASGRKLGDWIFMERPYGRLAFIFFILATFLRLLLYWVNSPDNAFDNHFMPIFLMIKDNTIPAKDACFQCYQPPVFYLISAIVGKIAVIMGANVDQIKKLLQFLPCFYGIITLVPIYLILKEVPLSDFSRLFAFGTICFLPRHIYMSAMNSNDTLSYLMVALCIYLLLIAIERNFSLKSLLTLSIAITITLFAKYTAFALIPVVMIVFAGALFKLPLANKRRSAALFFLTLFIPLSCLGFYASRNMKNYRNPLPWNLSMMSLLRNTSQNLFKTGPDYPGKMA